MKVKTEIINLYKKKIKEFKTHNKNYFGKDNPIISDSEYDKLKATIIDLEIQYPYLLKEGSINKIVGTEPSNKFKKIKHLKPMLSLSNAFDKSDMEFMARKLIELN